MPLWTRTERRARISRANYLLFMLLLSYCPNLSSATYYRWHDAQGAHYSDTPPASGTTAQAIRLNPARTLYEVEKVIDGDTFTLKGGDKVRLLGINAPEIAHRNTAAEPLGNEAHHRLQALLTHQRFYLDFDQQRRDRYGRLLAYVTLEDNTPVNEVLLQEGLARALFLQPNMHHLQHYYSIESEAQRARRGLWSLSSHHVRPSQRSSDCLKRFCRLQGKVIKVERSRRYSYLSLKGKLKVAIHHDQLEQFQAAGLDISRLKGRKITVRGWIGERSGAPYLRLEHPYQIEETLLK